MNKQAILLLIAGCAMVLTSSVFADSPPTKIIPMSTILQNLQADGYVAVKKVEFEDGFYEAEAINMQGEKMDVRLAPETGKIVKPESTKQTITMLAAIKRVEEAGYHDIYKVESERNEYEVKAFDKDGKKSALKIDFFNGNITKKLFD